MTSIVGAYESSVLCMSRTTASYDICREYELTPTVIDRYIKRINATESTKESDNRTPEEIELMKLRKENKRLLMKNDILKQAALIFAQR